MPTLAQIAVSTVPVDVQFGQTTTHIEYDPNKLTEDVFAEMIQFYSKQESGDPALVLQGFSALNDILVSLIKSWDLYANDADEQAGTAIPLTQEALKELPIMFRASLIGAIVSNIRPETIDPKAEKTGNSSVSDATSS